MSRFFVVICALGLCLSVGAEPLSLADALSRAADEDVRREAVRLGVKQVGHAAHQATARLSPRLTAGFTLTRNAKEIEVNGRVVSPLLQPLGTFNGRLTLFNGADIPEALASWTARDAAVADGVELELDLAQEVAARFLDAAEAKALVDAQRANLDWAEELVRVAEARAKNDEGLLLDVEVARGEKLRVEATVAQAQGALEASSAALALRLGMKATAALDPRCESCVPAPPVEATERAALRARALTEDAAATRGIGAWLAMLPTLELVGSARLQQPTLFNPEPLWWNAQLVASWTIFNGTGDWANVLGTSTTKRQAAVERAITERVVDEERARAAAGLKAAELSARAENARAEASGRALAYVEARYRQGLERALDVADAARQRSLAEQAAVRARYNLERAKLASWRAKGEIPGSQIGGADG